MRWIWSGALIAGGAYMAAAATPKYAVKHLAATVLVAGFFAAAKTSKGIVQKLAATTKEKHGDKLGIIDIQYQYTMLAAGLASGGSVSNETTFVISADFNEDVLRRRARGEIVVTGNPIVDATAQNLRIAARRSDVLERFGLAGDVTPETWMQNGRLVNVSLLALELHMLGRTRARPRSVRLVPSR